MKTKLGMSIAAVLAAAFFVQLGILIASGATTIPKVPKGWQFTFPDGDPKAGKVVFMNMQCYSCHTVKVPGEKFSAGSSGPDLAGYSTLPKEYFAESIIRAHAVVAAPGYVVKEGKASMGNYNHFMTIQEMIDIVAFLRHGLEKKER